MLQPFYIYESIPSHITSGQKKKKKMKAHCCKKLQEKKALS